ncbi:MAG TPA: hypothetical protein VN633_17015 [Bryobacteraceae bacterium]|nr:hypothetical protein [Bryobacteraceae bacterium]
MTEERCPIPSQPLRDADALIRKCQAVLARYLEPNQMTADDAIIELLGILDGPEQRRVQKDIGELVNGISPSTTTPTPSE